MKEFLYRQKQRLKYHLSSDNVLKRIAEINAYQPKITISQDKYTIDEINLSLPKGKFDFVFGHVAFNYLINNQKALKGAYELVEDTLYFSFGGIKVAITSASELFIINEIYIELCYNFQIPNDGKITVMDIGMNVGLASLFFASLAQVEEVHAFEPFKPTYRQAEVNFALNPQLSSKVKRYNFGLTNGIKTMEVAYNHGNKGINSTTSNKRLSVDTSIEKVELKDAANCLSSLCKTDTHIVLKVDTEGGEYEIFESFSKNGFSKNIKVVMIEWHFLGAGKLEKLLTSEGFICFSLKHGMESGLIYAAR